MKAALRQAWRVFLRVTGLQRVYRALRPPPYPGLRLTWRRFLNYQIVRLQYARGHTKLFGRPYVLTVEATNVCNLHCPYCFTGASEVGRERSMMSLELFQQVMDELGDTALYVEFYNWGEPLLNKKIYDMIRVASDRGGTIVSSNLSFPFDKARAEALVSSGLGAIGASIDGASQETLVQYRVGGDFERIMANMRLIVDAKLALGSASPKVTWSFHVFEHNQHEVEIARQLANELDVRFTATKGWVEGEEWDSDSDVKFPAWTEPTAQRCKYLWTQAVINNDGGAAPCCATFYKTDDFGSVSPGRFRDIWNNEQYQESRRLFRSRKSASPAGKSSICYDCPYTLVWHDYKAHRSAGHSKASFQSRFTTNDSFNYFFQKRPGGAAASAGGGEMIELEQVSAPKAE